MAYPETTFHAEGAPSVALAGRSLYRTSARDGAVLAAALVSGAATAALAAAVAVAPPSPAGAVAAAFLIALVVHWGSNTFAHIHLHTPLFRSPAANRWFSLYLTLLLRIPQTHWRARHLMHHHPERIARRDGWMAVEGALIAGLSIGAWLISPRLFAVLALGQLIGLGLCFLQGHYEHQGIPGGVDYHGPFYNRVWFNDGYHTAHHRWPERHWTLLPAAPAPDAPIATSGLPPVVRWIEDLRRVLNTAQAVTLNVLERATLRFAPLRRFLLATHRRSFAALLPCLPNLPGGGARIAVVGGGLFPRTALVLRQLCPDARLVLIDASADHLACAAAQLGKGAQAVQLVQASFPLPGHAQPFDVVIVPLAYRGDRAQLYRSPPAPVTFIHDWVWRRRGHHGRRISWWLLKRLNLVLT